MRIIWILDKCKDKFKSLWVFFIFYFIIQFCFDLHSFLQICWKSPKFCRAYSFMEILSLLNRFNKQVFENLACKLFCKNFNEVIVFAKIQQMEGFEAYEARRKKKLDKQIDSNVMMSSTALDEGIDLQWDGRVLFVIYCNK